MTRFFHLRGPLSDLCGFGLRPLSGRVATQAGTAFALATAMRVPLLAGAAFFGFLPLCAQGGDKDVARWEVIPGEVSVSSARVLKPLRRVGQSSAETSFGRISRIDADPTGGVLVYDALPSGRPLLLLGPSGQLLASMGAVGQGPGEFNHAISLAVTLDGQVVVYDSRAQRLTIWERGGKLVKVLPTPQFGGATQPGGVRPGPAGKVFIVQVVRTQGLRLGQAHWTHNASRYALFDLRSSAAVQLPWQEPIAPATQAHPFGLRYFREPLITGEIVEARSDHLGFRLLGEHTRAPDRFFVRFTAPHLSRGERLDAERYRDYLQTKIEPIVRPPRWDIPAVKQSVTDLRTDHRGRIWVRVATEGVAGPKRIVAWNSGGDTVSARFRDRQLWAAFLPSGRLLGSVLFPESIEDVVFSGTYAWGRERDEDGLEYLAQFRLPW